MASQDLVPAETRRYARDKRRVERGFWPKIRRLLGQVPFLEDAVAAYFCSRDPETPLQVKVVLLGALAYFVVPADLVPDFIAGFGFADDAAVLAAAIRTVAPAITDRHRALARQALARERPPGAASTPQL